MLLAEHLALALVAAAAGLAAGWLAAPLLTNPGAGLIGTAGAPSFTVSMAEQVTVVAVAVAMASAARGRQWPAEEAIERYRSAG